MIKTIISDVDADKYIYKTNLKFADEIIQKHKNNAMFYNEVLSNINGLKLLEKNPMHDSAYWIYSMLVENRDGFYKWMKECGIVVSQVHERNDKHTCVRNYVSHLPALDRTIDKIVSIPIGWWVSSEDREYLADCLLKGW